MQHRHTKCPLHAGEWREKIKDLKGGAEPEWLEEEMRNKDRQLYILYMVIGSFMSF